MKEVGLALSDNARSDLAEIVRRIVETAEPEKSFSSVPRLAARRGRTATWTSSLSSLRPTSGSSVREFAALYMG